MNRIEEIITELLILSKPNPTMNRQADVTRALKQTVALLKPQAHLKNIAIETDYRAVKSHPFCDENKLKQAFINFVKNAIEAIPDGGTMRIRTESAGDRIRIEIKDDGVGIPEDKLKKLGDPFFTAKESGTGLGFMVSKKIIEDHRGQLSWTSAAGKGTSITVLLPVA
jgi:signal transduction histidine kinase